MRVDSFDFALPEQCIAQAPCEPRDAARMLVVPASQNADAALNSAHIRDFPAYLNAGDVLVVNATRVIPARLWGVRHADAEGGSDIRVEILLHQPITPEDTTTKTHLWGFGLLPMPSPGYRRQVQQNRTAVGHVRMSVSVRAR